MNNLHFSPYLRTSLTIASDRRQSVGQSVSANRLWPQCPYSPTDLSEDPDRLRGPTRFLPFGPRAWQEKTAEMPVPTAICGSPTQCCRCCAPGEASGVQSDLSWEDESGQQQKRSDL